MLLLRFCHENRKAQKYLLGGFEKIVGDVYKDRLLNSAAHVLKQFYDQDIIEEEAIIEWSAKESKKYVSKDMSKKIHEKCAPLVKWLKEAEVEEDEDEEDEDEDEEEEDEEVEDNNEKEDEDEDDMLEFSHRVSGLQIEAVKPSVVVKPVNASETSQAEHEEDFDIDNI